MMLFSLAVIAGGYEANAKEKLVIGFSQIGAESA
jgi:hypothetical protein